MLKVIGQWFARFDADDRGGVSVEQVLVIALVALPLLIAMVGFRDKIKEWFDGKVTDLEGKKDFSH